MINLDELIIGSIDMHIHTAPDVIPMRLDALEAARQAKAAGMRAIVIKNHFYPTAPLAEMVSQLVPGIGVFGGICLDKEIGCLNPHALEISAKLGAKIVWMATLSAANGFVRETNDLGLKIKHVVYSILNNHGKLVPEIDEILKIVKDYDLILASGHISPQETYALFSEARKMGIGKMIVTHASSTEVFKIAPSIEDQKKFVQMGAYIEYTAADIMPDAFDHDPKEMAETIKAIGAEHCILSTDTGMANGIYPTEGMRVFVSTLLRQGISPLEIEKMIKINTAKLLGLK